MNINILIEYCTKCEMYDWTASWEGLKKYAMLRKKELIKLWVS